MARKPATNARKRAAKPKAAAAATNDQAARQTSAAADTEIPAASGAEAKPEDAAASEGGTEAKASEGAHNLGAADAADPNGTASAPAAQAEETREQAGAASADRKDAAEEGKQPEETAQPPVAGPDAEEVLVVIGPKKGRRRVGLLFSREPRELTRGEFGDLGDNEGRARFIAIVSDPALRCFMRMTDGTELPFDDETCAKVLDAFGAAADDSEESDNA